MEADLEALRSEIESEKKCLGNKRQRFTLAQKALRDSEAEVMAIEETRLKLSSLDREISEAEENLKSLSILDRSTKIQEFEKKLNFLRAFELPEAVSSDEEMVSNAADLTLKQMALDLKIAQLQVRYSFQEFTVKRVV